MKQRKRPFVVEIRHNHRSQKSPGRSIWGDIDLRAYTHPDADPDTGAERSMIGSPTEMISSHRAISGTHEAKANEATTVEVTEHDVEPLASSPIGVVKAYGLHYVQVYTHGTAHELIGPFRTRGEAQTEAAKWIGRFTAEPQT
jgi:hypothetical protein